MYMARFMKLIQIKAPVFLSLTVVFFILWGSAACSANSDVIPTANQGVLDLRDWDFKKAALWKLQGIWNFSSATF